MGSETWARVEDLFERAVELDGPERRALLDAERAAAPDVVAQVERLLRKDQDGSGDFLESLERGTWLAGEDVLLGRELGPYRLVERLASGGMGVVYRAQRTDGLFERDVAVKLIRAERVSSTTVRRFELERRALAALDHPHIARLYDGGSADGGSPYLVMELVRGLPIDRFCDERRLPVAGRLRLFADVCRAVDFAHRNLIVHRDLKPSNVLVDEHGGPKLLDFGIARLLDDDPAERAATRTVARVLTPEYASPEQLTGGPVTTAIDVYSLGVMLYELLAGSKPFERHSRSPVDWQRTVTERMPERPSDALLRGPRQDAGTPADGGASPAEVAARRATTPGALRRLLQGDLDRIVLMALRKEPERRYASARALAEDLERHLAGLPVAAREDSLRYRTAKFVRRNRIQVAAAAAVLLALGVALVATWRGGRRALAEAEHARIEAESLEGVADFVLDTFLTSDLSADPARRAAALERVDLQAERVRVQHAGRPHLRANLLDALGRIALRLGALDDAAALAREALAVRERTFGARSLETALSLRSLGLLHHERGEPQAAAACFERALELNRSLPLGTHTDVATLANDLAVCRRRLGDLAGAEELHREALALRRRQGARSLPVAESANNLAGIHLDRGEYGPAAELLAEALEIRRAVLTPRHALTLQSLQNLALPVWQLGERERAIALLEEAAEGMRVLRGAGEPGLGRTLANLGGMRVVLGDLEGAAGNLGEALELERGRLGADHPSLAGLHMKLAAFQRARGERGAARASWERAVELRRAPAGSPLDLAVALHGFGRFLLESAGAQEALAVFEESAALLRADPASEPLARGRAELALGECLLKLARAQEARGPLEEALRLLADQPAATVDLRRARTLLEEGP